MYPGDREDAIDFSVPGHERHLLEGWHELEGTYGNKYRWIGRRATAVLKRVTPGPMQLRIRGFAQNSAFDSGAPEIEVLVNGTRVGLWTLERSGLFVLEAYVPDAAEYGVEILAMPEWRAPGDERTFTVNLSMLRLIPRED